MIDIAHIHPMLVHFPLALLPVALAMQMLALFKGRWLFEPHCLSATSIALIVIAASAAIVAVIFGDIALDQAVASGVPLATLEQHEELGKLSGVLLAALAVAGVWIYRQTNTNKNVNWVFWFVGLAVLVVLLSTAWFGGQLVYEQGVNVSQAVVH